MRWHQPRLGAMGEEDELDQQAHECNQSRKRSYHQLRQNDISWLELPDCDVRPDR